MNSKIKNSLQLLLIAIFIIIFVIIVKQVLADEISIFDSTIYNYISKFIKEPITTILRIITNFAGPLFIIILTVIILVVCKDKKYKAYIVLNLFTVTIINQILKFIIKRPRPDELFRLIKEDGYSFPSGHSMVSMAFYGLLIYFAYTKIQNKKLKWATCIILSLLILTIGTSRIYLGVHYASDVIGGFLLSIVYLYIFIKAIVQPFYSSRCIIDFHKKLKKV